MVIHQRVACAENTQVLLKPHVRLVDLQLLEVRCLCSIEARWKLTGLHLHLTRACGLHLASNRGLRPCNHLPRALICVLKVCRTMETSTLRLNPLRRSPLGEEVVSQNRERKPFKALSVMPEGDHHMQAGKGRTVWRKGEAGELIFKRMFEETFTSKSKFNPLFDVEVEMVSNTGNTTAISPNSESRPQIDNGKSSVLRFPFSKPLCVQQEDHSPTNPRSNDVFTNSWEDVLSREICTRGKNRTRGLGREIHIDVSVLHFKSSSEQAKIY